MIGKHYQMCVTSQLLADEIPTIFPMKIKKNVKMCMK